MGDLLRLLIASKAPSDSRRYSLERGRMRDGRMGEVRVALANRMIIVTKSPGHFINHGLGEAEAGSSPI